MKAIKAITFSLLAVILLTAAIDDTEGYKKKELEDYSVSEGDWDDAKSGIDFSDERHPKPARNTPDIDLPNAPDIDVPDFQIAPFMQVFMYLIIVAVLVFLIYKLAFGGSIRSSKKLEKRKVITLENLEEHIHETELDKFLREALASNNHKQAIRVQYLMILKAASENKWITWKKDKTNGEYLQEMFARPEFSEFRALTLIFERVWYGAYTIGAEEYPQLDTRFSSYLKQISRG